MGYPNDAYDLVDYTGVDVEAAKTLQVLWFGKRLMVSDLIWTQFMELRI